MIFTYEDSSCNAKADCVKLNIEPVTCANNFLSIAKHQKKLSPSCGIDAIIKFSPKLEVALVVATMYPGPESRGKLK